MDVLGIRCRVTDKEAEPSRAANPLEREGKERKPRTRRDATHAVDEATQARAPSAKG